MYGHHDYSSPQQQHQPHLHHEQHLKRRWDHRISGSGNVVGSREEEAGGGGEPEAKKERKPWLCISTRAPFFSPTWELFNQGLSGLCILYSVYLSTQAGGGMTERHHVSLCRIQTLSRFFSLAVVWRKRLSCRLLP